MRGALFQQALQACRPDGAKLKPRTSIEHLSRQFEEGFDRQDWIGRARIAALLGACPKSKASFKSGVRCYIAFAMQVLAKCREEVLPPSVDDLLAWSMVFRCADTFSNYLAASYSGALTR